MFPYTVLMERKTALKENINRNKARLLETNDKEMKEILQNMLQEDQELLNMVNVEINHFKQSNTNR